VACLADLLDNESGDGRQPLELEDDSKIWKYMDLGKFASMLTTRSLYFACPVQFSDPYEGVLPKSHIEAEAKITQALLDPIIALTKQIANAIGAEQVEAHTRLQALNLSIDQMRRTRHREVNAKFGVSCWHQSEHESDAMWKLYSASGQGIAIESTVGQLRTCFENRDDFQIDRVRYMDFDRDPIEKNHKRYRLFIKRKSFECEREVRATILLPTEGAGVSVECDLNVLVTQIHVSPLVERFVSDAIEALCSGSVRCLSKPLRHSPLYSPPAEYEIDIDSAQPVSSQSPKLS
jgi:hypothetical protein